MENGIKKIGSVGVDSGQVIITDPCYLKGFENNEFTANDEEVKKMQESGNFPYSYEGACARTLSEQQGGEIGLGEQGVVSSSGFGDGEYPVYAEYSEGRVKALRIVFF